MKKTWKRWLGTVAAALVTSTALAQGSNDVGVATTRGQSPSFSEEGSVRMGRASASARGTRIRQSQYVPSVDAGDVVEDIMDGSYMPGGSGSSIFSDDGAVGFASTDRVNDILWRVGNQSLNAYGYNGGYTNLNAFVPVFTDGSQNVVFAIPRVNFTDYGKLGANLGVGYRTYSPGNDRVYGVSGWWDFDNGHRSDYQQWGMNFESIGRWLSLRGGFALPTGSDSYIYNTVNSGEEFVGNNISVLQTKFFERSYSNYNAEIATPLPGLARYGFDVGMGMYVLQSPGLSNIVGGSLRTQAQLTDSAWINGTYTYDHHFKSMFSVNVELTLPDGPPKQWFRRNSVQSSLTDNVIRNYRIAVTDQTTSERVLVPGGGGGGGGGGTGGDPLYVGFIDANAPVAGDGSRSNPFRSLSEYMSVPDRSIYDIIYIRGMVDGTDTNLDTGLTLLDTQRVLGDGLLADGSRPKLSTGVGTIQLPTTGGQLPLLSNAAALGSPVVTLANANEISGIRIDGSSDISGSNGRGIVGPGIDSFNIHDTTITNVITGIDITSNTTPVQPTGSEDNRGIIKNVSISSGISGIKGINLNHSAGTLDLLITGNTISGFQGEDANQNGVVDLLDEDTNGNGILDPGEDKDFDGVLDLSEDKNGNGILDFGQAMEIIASGGTINANNPTSTTRPTGITSNTFASNGRGMHLLASNGGDFFATVANNTSTGATDSQGAAFLIEANGAGSTMNLLDSINNVASGGLGDGLVLMNVNNGTLNVTSSTTGQSALAGNSYTNNEGDGLKIVANNATLTIGSLSNLTFTGNTGDGIELQATGGGTLTVTDPVINSQFTNNDGNGLNLNAAGGTVNIAIGQDVVNTDGTITRRGNMFTGNGIAGLAFNSSAGGVINTDIRNNNASNNDGDGIRFNLVGTTLSPTTIRNNTVNDNAGSGLAIQASGGSTLSGLAIHGNSFSRNSDGSGILVNLADSNSGEITVSSNLMDDNSEYGISYDLDHSQVSVINIVNNSGSSTVTASAQLQVTGDTHGPTTGALTGAWSLANTSSGNLNIQDFSIDLSPEYFLDTAGGGDLPFTSFAGETATGLQTVNGQPPNTTAVADNETVLNLTFNDFNKGETYQWDVDTDDAGTSDVDSTPEVVVTGDELIGKTANVTFIQASGTTRTASGTLVANPNATNGSIATMSATFSRNAGITNNGLGGVNVQASNNSSVGAMLVQGNRIEENGGPGVGIVLTDTSQLSMAADGGIKGNQINNNLGANVAVDMSEQSRGTMYIQDNTITGAIAPAATANSLLTGEGINIRLTDTAVMNGGGVIHNTITNNAGDGMRVNIIGNNDAGNVNTIAAQLNNFAIGSTTAGQGNLFRGNGDDGLEINRTERGQFNNLLVQNNIFNANTDDGMIVNVSGASQGNMQNLSPDSMNVNINDFTSNGGDGIEFRLEADADLVANLDQNIITGNAEDGIYVSENINDARDSRSLTGVWTRNNISNNTFSGIQIQSWVGNTANDAEAGMGLIIGSTTINPVGTRGSMGNVISRNRLDGIQYTGVGVMSIGNNVITLNGTENTDPVTGAVLGTYNNAGINIQGQEVEDEGAIYHSGEFPISFDDDNAPGRAAQEVNVLSNLISQNIGDGIRWLNEGGHDAFNLRLSSGPPQAAITSSLNIRNNEITINEGRGISAITRPEDTDTTDIDNTDPKASSSRFTNIELSREVIGDLTIIGNHVKGNKLEGIYVVTTNSSNQSIVSQSRDLLEETGSVIAQVNLRADIHNNEIIGNGSEVIDFPATGLVVRVGSSGGGYSQFFAGGFATTGTNLEDTNNDGVLDVDLDGNGVLSASTNFNAGISMSVTGNTFDGNAGDDVLFHSFRSTADPATASGTWTETEFTQSGYRGDPLARMDLIFSNNAFSSIEGNNLDTTIADNFQVGAYYNDPDGIFKSRLFAAADPTSGPFTNAARIRNAQRLGARFGLAPNPSIPPGTGGLLYAGIGQSTFRVRGTGNAYTDQGLGAVNIADIFILDDVPFNSVFSANGVFPVSPNATGGGGESPWGWGGF